MNPESDTRNPGERLVRVLFLHGKTAVPSVVPADCARFGCVVETAEYGSAILCHLLRRDFDVIAASVEEGQVASHSAFLREIQKIWPWMGWVITGPSATPETEQLARDIGTTNIVLEQGSADKLCGAIRTLSLIHI